MGTILDETLELWREAERLLDVVPERTADHETLSLAVLRLRRTHAHLTGATDQTEAMLLSSRETIAAGRALLTDVRRRLSAADNEAAGAEIGSTIRIAPGGSVATEIDGRPIRVETGLCRAVVWPRDGEIHHCRRRGWFALQATDGAFVAPLCGPHLRGLLQRGGEVVA